MNKLDEYLKNGIKNIIIGALMASDKNKKETTFIKSIVKNSKHAMKLRSNYSTPPFIICSVTDCCNLNCKGCYAMHNKIENVKLLETEKWESVFTQAEEIGIQFIFLAGGEPMLRKKVIEAAALHKKSVFPLFTNGTLIDEKDIIFFDENRNILPIISIEGDDEETDYRRGKGVSESISKVEAGFKKHSIMYGVSITITNRNFQKVHSRDFIEKLKNLGVSVVFFVEYVPVEIEKLSLAIGNKERSLIEKELAKRKTEFPNMLFISFPGDELKSGGCLAAGRGFFHINAYGGIEPCPFSPFSDSNIKDISLKNAVKSPLLKKLRDSGFLEEDHKGGCVLFGKESQIKKYLNKG